MRNNPYANPNNKRSSCGLWLLMGCIVALATCICLAGVGFLVYQRGLLTPETLLNVLGVGPGDIEVDNFRDDSIQVSILQLDPAEDSTPTQGNLQLNAFDIRTYRAQQPGRYRVDFGSASGSADLGTCTLTIKSGDQYQFVLLPERIVVNRANHPSSNGTDFIIESSTLCQ